jgi:glucose/arabinose dehydrogenase
MGLLGLAFHPDYAENGEFIVHYNRDGDGMTVIARYHVSPDDPDRADPDSAEIIFTQAQPYGNHNGGQIEFGPDGYLYLALGDGGSAGDPQNNAQNPQILLGSILRLDVDGDAPYAIPSDNPAMTTLPELAPEIWAWGLRNPYRFSFDRATGDLYIADVGQNQWEEINFQPADSGGGENYGWRIWEASHRYQSDQADTGDTVLPILEYSHAEGCSVTGGYVYRGETIPELQGVYVYGDFCSGRVFGGYRDMDGNWQSSVLLQTPHQITGFGEDETGDLYLIAYGGSLLRFSPA